MAHEALTTSHEHPSSHRNAYNSPWTPELRERVAELSAKGLTTREIGNLVGLTRNQIVGWLWRSHCSKHAPKDSLSRMRSKADALQARADRMRARADAMRGRADAMHAEAAALLRDIEMEQTNAS